GSIDAAPNVVDIGTSAYKAQGGWNVITGTVVQPGGFMSAMRMHIEADSINAVNNAFLIRNADGTVDEAATVALVNQLKANLGLNYTEGTVADDIHTQFIKEKKGGLGPIGMVVAMVAAVAISIVTAGAGTAIVGAAYSAVMGATVAAGASFAAAGIGAAMSLAVSGLIAGTLSSMASQLITTGSLNMGAALKAGIVSGATAGLTQGGLGGLDLGDVGIKSISDSLVKGSWDAVQSNLGGYVAASVVRSAISAGVNTVAYGGSFGQAFANGLVRDAAAVGANAIGVKLPGIGMVNPDTGTILANAASHALLGCAAASLSGGDCAGGAVGGAASAIAAPLIRDGLYAGSQTVIDNGDGTLTVKYENTSYNAATVALATLIGGSAGALLGTNATAATLAAQNEALNNSTSDKVVKWAKETYQDPLGDLARWGKEFLGMLPGQTPPTEANPLVDVTNGGNPPATGGAVVTPPVAACSPGGPCLMTPPLVSPGAPGNAVLSSGNSESGSGSGSGSSTSGLPTTDAVSVSGNRSIDKAQSYENAVQGMYNKTPFAERQYAAVVNGQRVSGVADDVAILDGKLTAVEAKYADDWSTSLRNPSSPYGMSPWARAEQQNMVTQAQKYAAGFDGGVVYHTNSPQLAAYYSQVFRNAGVKNFKFVITPIK
ncbi:hemagglutinin-related protein, partial [Cupriavidus basilensis OR16]